ncbi:DUF4126 domain-containing protein [Arhodomonas sp. SL1]|uniref:DUF4126 domain-containing protein n=1 Tax=Arhodomonas sp. SL1 TaxID=3425691 RepID=UPI003F88416B
MTGLEQLTATIALTLGVGWASGINLYAAILGLGLMHNLGHVTLPPSLEIVGEPLVLAAAGFMYAVEFFADKTPGVDTGWDALHTFIRLPAGAVLAMAAVGEVSLAAEIAAGLVGGGLAAGSHAVKAGGRALINTSPEPVTNWGASIGEDAMVFGGLWLALQYPLAFLLALVAFIALAVWLLPRIWRGLRRVFRTVTGRDGGDPPPEPPAPEGPPVQPRLGGKRQR